MSGLEVELLGDEGLLYGDWTMVRPELVDFTGRDAGYRYLRSKGNSIEGGTSEILLNIVAERVLGLPARTPQRQGRRLEGPEPMTAPTQPSATPDLLYTRDEEDLRSAVRALLTDRADAPTVIAATESDTPYDPRLYSTYAMHDEISFPYQELASSV
ncbi:hypothetical protein SSPIM334S_04283 [Streptomyces spiroverticillatus]